MREKRQAQQEEASPERVSHRLAAAVPHSVVTDSPDRALQLRTLMDAPIYWTARAMQEQGSRFFQALGMALEAADLSNRRLIFQTWPAECWDFYGRGQVLAAAEQH